MKAKPTNRFVATVTVNFPGRPECSNLLRWFNLQNCGKETIPLTTKVSDTHKENAYKLHKSRIYNLVFDITKDGEWIYVGRLVK